jgi:hypothetical protein
LEDLFTARKRKSVMGLSRAQMGEITDLLDEDGVAALLIMPTCAVFIYRHNDRFWMFKERGRRNGGAGVFSSITAQALLGCVAILGGDFRDSDFKEGAAAVGGQMETEFSVLCEPWCDMSGDRNVEHVFACSNMRKLFCETCSGALPLQVVIDIFLAMRSAQNDISNLRVTPADVNQALVPLQLWSMGGTSPRWHGYYAASWGGCVDMGVLRVDGCSCPGMIPGA